MLCGVVSIHAVAAREAAGQTVGVSAPATADTQLPQDGAVRDGDGRATIGAVRLTQPLRVDGRLDEEIYASIPSINQFTQTMPDHGRPATQKTESWIFFDANNIYVSCRCWDTRPEKEWIANEMRRDRVSQGDHFGVMFDTFFDRRNAYVFMTTPYGALADATVTNETYPANGDFNPVWTVRSGRFSGGWTVEMQIPFKSLRYQAGRSQTWGVQLRRGIRERNEWVYATPLPISIGMMGFSRVSTAATLSGLEVPPGSRNLGIKPYVTAGLTSDTVVTPTISKQVSRDAGVDARYAISQNLTLDFNYNMDVAQVEVDEQQINLTRFNLLYPEKRDFFLEGRGLYEFGRTFDGGAGDAPELFFSRQIGLQRGRVVPIVGGGRLTGKSGKTSFGAINLQTDSEPAAQADATNFTVLRVKRDILRRSSIGAIFTNRSESAVVPGESNQAYGVDGQFSFYQNVVFGGYYANTSTPGLRGARDSYQARFDYYGDRYGLSAEHLFVGDAFNPEVGFVRRANMRRNLLNARFSPRPRAMGSVARFVYTGGVEYAMNVAGELESELQSAGFATEFRNSDKIAVDAKHTYDLLTQPFRIAPGVTIPVGDYRFESARVSYTRGSQHSFSGTIGLERGTFYGGDQTILDYNARLAMTRQLSLEPSASINKIDLPYGAFTAQVYRARAIYTFTPLMFFIGLVQYNSSSHTVNTNLRMRWEYSPGSELFVVYTEEQDTHFRPAPLSGMLNRALVVKVNRLLRF
jgi:hypothetical protein